MGQVISYDHWRDWFANIREMNDVRQIAVKTGSDFVGHDEICDAYYSIVFVHAGTSFPANPSSSGVF
jgi:hypothetical protein